jgi:hypothetical protein
MGAEPRPRRASRRARLGRWLRARRSASIATLDTVSGAFACSGLGFASVAPVQDLRRLTTFELCRVWRANDPAAFDPRRFLAESSPDAPPADPATVDWDELTRGQG